MQLYLDDGTTPGQLDGGDSFVADVTTASTGTVGEYRFTGLQPGNYLVHIPADNFNNNGTNDALYEYLSSTGFGTTDDDDDDDEKEDGIDNDDPATNGITSGLVVLSPFTEPTSSDDETGTNGDDDANSNLTVDFGFLQYDFGDSPDTNTQTTTLSGAHHGLDGRTFLGDGVDNDLDGDPNSMATGDDNDDGNDDEDGITFTSAIIPTQDATLTVDANAGGYLYAWIDWDGDGFDVGDFVTFTEGNYLTDGDNELTISSAQIAANTPVPTTLHTRFRFTRDAWASPSPTGPALTGEVEDYVLMSLGNLVWIDNGAGVAGIANNGIIDGGESGRNDVLVELFRDHGGADDAGDDLFEPTGVGAGLDGTPISSMNTVTSSGNDGTYLFTGLQPGQYFVRVAGSNFGSGGELYEYLSTADPGGTPKRSE